MSNKLDWEKTRAASKAWASRPLPVEQTHSPASAERKAANAFAICIRDLKIAQSRLRYLRKGTQEHAQALSNIAAKHRRLTAASNTLKAVRARLIAKSDQSITKSDETG